jgi:crotonobetainyl-CoA:carnitine CoA-transferase CaiB-like acyl-CoA transferase
MSALQGLRVVELSRRAPAAYCGRQFAKWGADVVVVEPEGGSLLRRLHPLARGTDGRIYSLFWSYVAANKRSLAQTAVTRPGALDDLLGRADVFVTDWTDVDLEPAFGTTLQAIHVAHPHLAMVSITPFGLHGPYSAFEGTELVSQALSGYLALNGLPDRPPLRAPGHLTGYSAGVNGFVAGLGCYLKYLRTGQADLAEVSEMETLASMIPYLRVEYTGHDIIREGGNAAGVRLFPCADGWVSMLPLNPLQKDVFAAVLDIPDDAWPADLYEGEYMERVNKSVAFFSQFTRRKTMEQIFEGLEQRGIVCGKALSPHDLLTLEQLEARRFFRTFDHPALGTLKFPGPAARLSELNMMPPAPAPEGACADVADLDWTERERGTIDPVQAKRRPLEGLRVVDLTQAWIGPFSTLLLADMGAEVIKVESHKRPDVWRQASPNPVAIKNVRAERVNRSYYFNSVNRDKLGVALDLKSERGKALFLKLVENADIVTENYTPRVMGNFGLDFETLTGTKPDLVMASFSGFGKSGPISDYKSNGAAIEAMAGWDVLHRYANGEPVLMGFYQADAISGLQMCALTLLSLVHRQRTGRGQNIDGAMLEASAGYIGEALLAAQLEVDLGSGGNGDPDMAPHGVYACAGHDRWIAIAVPDDAHWARLLDVDGAPASLRAERFATTASRLAHRIELDAALQSWTERQDAEQLMMDLQRAGVAAGVVRGAAEGLDEPHLHARSWFQALTHPDLGTHRYNGFLWRFADAEMRSALPPPRLGEHSRTVLHQHLGLSESEIDVLWQAGVTGAVMTEYGAASAPEPTGSE